MTVSVLTAACGSIEVVSSDGSTGTGGTLGAGGSGGMQGGGSGGVRGAGGSGGIGGNNGGSGGSNGVGGKGAGGTGVGGMGVGGSSGTSDAGASCADIQKAFVIALANAKSCVVGASGYCGVTTSDRLDCGCPTHVNSTNKIDPIRTSWAQNGCSSGVCNGSVCLSYPSAICSVPSGATAAVCQDSLAAPTP